MDPKNGCQDSQTSYMVDEDSLRENFQRQTWKLPVCKYLSLDSGTVSFHHFLLVRVVIELTQIKGVCACLCVCVYVLGVGDL